MNRRFKLFKMANFNEITIEVTRKNTEPVQSQHGFIYSSKHQIPVPSEQKKTNMKSVMKYSQWHE